MTELVPKHKSLTETYHDLLLRRRSLELAESNEEASCSWCGNKRSKHLHDGRCNVYATSQYYASNQRETVNAIDRALILIEELFRLKTT